MKPRERRETGARNLFHSRLDQIIKLKHELVRLAKVVSWAAIEAKCSEVYADGPGMPPLPTWLTPAIERQMRRRAAIEPVIGHIKNEHRMSRNYLAHEQDDASNAVLAAAGYSFCQLLTWLRLLLRLWLAMLLATIRPLPA